MTSIIIEIILAVIGTLSSFSGIKLFHSYKKIKKQLHQAKTELLNTNELQSIVNQNAKLIIFNENNEETMALNISESTTILIKNSIVTIELII